MDTVQEKKTGAELVGSWTVEIGDQDEASMYMCIFICSCFSITKEWIYCDTYLYFTGTCRDHLDYVEESSEAVNKTKVAS